MSDEGPQRSSNSREGTSSVAESDIVHVSVPTPTLDTIEAPAGTRASRYIVLEEVGRGGMGRVVRAYDAKLQREVALKEMHGDRLDADIAARLVAEARAMAKLSHPNVVAVFDIEQRPSNQVVLVMEFVTGQTLKAWLDEEQRPSMQIVRRFVAAGRGLVAAHAVGLLHRDFKPANVLVSAGIVKVTDFGLAQANDAASLHSSYLSSDTDTDAERTLAGGVIGTPRYMAPEQHRNAPLTSAVDQYAFCVALWEALCGSPPFSGEAQAQAKEAGPPRWPQPNTPRPIVHAVIRGLSPRPEDRWPSMGPLLGALAGGPSRRRNRVLGGLGGLGVLGLAGVSHGAWADARAARCTGSQTQLAGIWNDARRAQVHTAFAAIGKVYADRAGARAERTLDTYANDWAAMHTEACEASSVRGEQSPQTMDLRMGCLHRAAVDLQMTAETLADADARVVQRADNVTGALPGLDRCADIEALEAEVDPPPAEEADAVEAARVELARARTMEHAGRYDAAQQAVDSAKEVLAGVAYEPVQIEVALVDGFVLAQRGAYEASAAALMTALRGAARRKQGKEVRGAAGQLMYVIGYQQGRTQDALQFRPLVEGLSSGDAEAEGSFHMRLAAVVQAQGKYAEAAAEFRAAVVLITAALGPAHPHVATPRNNLATVLAKQGRYAEAEAEFYAAQALWAAALGPEHPKVAASHHNISVLLMYRGKYTEAAAEQRTALAIREAALRPDHPDIAASRGNLANILLSQGKYTEAEAEFRAVLALQEMVLGLDHLDVVVLHSNLAVALMSQGKYADAEVEQRGALATLTTAHGAKHPEVASCRNHLAGVLLRQGKYTEAEAELRAALALGTTALGPGHPQVAASRNELADVLLRQGKYGEAEVEQRAALALREAGLEPGHPSIAESQDQLAGILLKLKRPAEALPLAELAWRQRRQGDVPPEHRAKTAFVLACALWAVKGPAGDHARARGLAQDALASYDRADTGTTTGRGEVEQWLHLNRRP